MAAEAGHENIVKYLVKKQVDVNIKDEHGVSIYKTILLRVDQHYLFESYMLSQVMYHRIGLSGTHRYLAHIAY